MKIPNCKVCGRRMKAEYRVFGPDKEGEADTYRCMLFCHKTDTRLHKHHHYLHGIGIGKTKELAMKDALKSLRSMKK